MFVSNSVVWCFYVITNLVLADIAADYFFRSSLRESSEELSCDNVALRQYCETRCGENHACLFGKCFCLQSHDEQRSLLVKVPHKEDQFPDFDDYSEVTPLMSADTYSERPALRHHIAHFCPNLEEARKCIRKCMQLGKPAFCGKDHVCYCGHKYNSHSKDDKLDVNDIYAQFRDLYAKYFGSSGDSHSRDDNH